MPQFEVRYHLGDSSMQVTIVSAEDKQKAFCLIEEELKESDEGYRILEINRVN